MAYSNHLLFNNVFLQKLAPSDEELAAAKHLVYESARDWYREDSFTTPESIATNWMRPLLNQQSLDLVPTSPEGSAWHLVAPWDRSTPLGVCFVASAGTDLDGYDPDGSLPKGRHWTIRAINAASGGGLRWAILTNGVQWRLLDASGLRRYEAYLEVDLGNLLRGEDDPLAAYLFYRLFRLEDAFEQVEGTAGQGIDAFLEASTKATEETEEHLKITVTDDLGTPGGGDGIMAQLCMGLVNAIDPDGTHSFTEEERAAIYRDATYLLYRLLFILYAEARDLLPMDRADYRRVSLTHLIDEVTEYRLQPGNVDANSTSLWEQLDTLFNAIHYSDEYLGIPPYNGGLFEDEDKPYLIEYRISNRFLMEALYQLAFIVDRDRSHQPERIDYCDLSVRHLGSLFEGMIEYQLFVAEEELLARLERKGKTSRIRYLPASSTARKPTDEIITPGKVYFAQSSNERKATGTHYTPEPLVARLVQQTVGRLLDERWADFEPNLQEWLSEIEATPSPEIRARLQAYVDAQLEAFVQEQVLSLSICDPAMGSGHFLVHVAHTLTNFILQTLSATLWGNPALNLNPSYWRRQVVEHCLYGVDINGMAVELAKLSLWLATMQAGRPLSFLDHHLKQGNSLLGARLDEIISVLENDEFNKQTRVTRLAEERGQLAFHTIPKVIQSIGQANQRLDEIAQTLASTIDDISEQEGYYESAQEILEPYKRIGDLLVAQKMGLSAKEGDLRAIAGALESGSVDNLSEEHQAILLSADRCLERHKTLHWDLEFSRQFIDGQTEGKSSHGYDVVIGNPPYLGGSKISTEIGNDYLAFLKESFSPSKQNTDLCAYFVRQGVNQVKPGGCLGMVTTNTIGEGDTREGGLDVILQDGATIYFAERRISWPGDASVEVNLIAVAGSSSFRGTIKLDGNPVNYISSYLDDLSEAIPVPLQQNRDKAFLGSVIYGTGFLLDKSEAKLLVDKNPLNERCLVPYLIGRDINQDPEHRTDRYVIYFRDWELNKAEHYPDLLDIVRKKVKPYRDGLKDKVYRERWWRFGRDCVGLRKKLPYLTQVLIRSRVSEYHMLAFVPKGQVYGDATVVFAYDEYYHFALLQSYVHEVWLRRQASSLRTDIRYTPTDCFQTFPFPQVAQPLAQRAAQYAGERYYERRQATMLARQLGLTKTYNLFHDPECEDEDITEMRRLHAAMDEAILRCYGWEDIDLGYGFYPNDRGKIRYMPSRTAQRTLFTRLIDLNQLIAAQEAAQSIAAEEDEEYGDDESE